MAPSDPEAILAVLAQAEVPFVIIGGHAVTFHGYIRTTEDADIVFLRNQQSERSLLNALQSIGACWVSNEKNPATGLEKLVPVNQQFIQSNHLMKLWTELGFLDIYDFIPGFPATPVDELFKDSVAAGNLRFVSLPWLRKLKAAAARHKDLDDLEHLPEV
jgi:hypothetical protein